MVMFSVYKIIYSVYNILYNSVYQTFVEYEIWNIKVFIACPTTLSWLYSTKNIVAVESFVVW